MTLLSRKADYALLILSHLHEKAGGGNARAIAERFGLSRAFVANILKELCQKEFVSSHRGVKGGYTLTRSAHTTTLAELLESLDDGFHLTACSEPAAAAPACSHAAGCTVKGPLAEVQRRLVEVLRGVTLADLFDPAFPRPLPFPALPMLAAGGCCSNKPLAVDPSPA